MAFSREQKRAEYEKRRRLKWAHEKLWGSPLKKKVGIMKIQRMEELPMPSFYTRLGKGFALGFFSKGMQRAIFYSGLAALSAFLLSLQVELETTDFVWLIPILNWVAVFVKQTYDAYKRG